MSRLSCSLSLNGCLCFLLLQPSVCSSVQRAGARERLLADLDRDRASAHAIGTARALEMGEVEGAMSGLAIGVSGILTVLLSSLFAGLM